VQIDYAAGKVRILNREELHASGEILPLSMRNGAMCVRVRVNGGSAKWMRIDTGCNSAVECVASDSTAKKLARPSVATAAGSPRFISGEITLGNAHATSVKVGLHERAFFAGESGLLGNALLSRFRITIDHPKKRLILGTI
jgi:hypothetical protein